MKPFRVYKVDELPAQPQPNAVYYVALNGAVQQFITDDNGTPLTMVSDGGALQIVNQLSEFSDEPSKAAARENLGVEYIDGGTFF